jgi:hypothetical protein
MSNLTTQQIQNNFRLLSEPATVFFDKLYGGELTNDVAGLMFNTRDSMLKTMGADWTYSVINKCHKLILESICGQ